MKNLIFLLLLSTSFSNIQANTKKVLVKKMNTVQQIKQEKNNVQLLYHGDCSYSLTEPKGWLANPKPVQMSDLITLLVNYEPKSAIKHKAPIGVYSYVVFKDGYYKTMADYINADIKSSLERGEIITDAKSLQTQDNKTATIKRFVLSAANEYFAIAYINEPKYIITINYSAKDKTDFNIFYKSFESIVQSYKYLGLRVIDGSK